MWNNQQVKERGKAAFQANYWVCVLASLVMIYGATGSILGSNNSSYTSLLRSINLSNPLASIEYLSQQLGIIFGGAVRSAAAFFILKMMILNPLTVGGYKFFRDNHKSEGKIINFLHPFDNNYGNCIKAMFLRDVFIGIWTIGGSVLFFLMLVIAVAARSVVFVWLGVLVVIASFVMSIIWSYKYRMVPYIISDHSDMQASDVLRRSDEMMNGQKMELFVFDLSYIGWTILSAFTFGILQIFFVFPYKTSAEALIYEAIKGGRGYYGGTPGGYSGPAPSDYSGSASGSSSGKIVYGSGMSAEPSSGSDRYGASSAPKMVYCTHCGSPMESTDAFCTKCGTRRE